MRLLVYASRRRRTNDYRMRFTVLDHARRSSSILLLMILMGTPAYAIVIRDDVPDARYLAADGELPALVDLPSEGHGVLIAPRWVVTVAHAVRWGTPKEVMIMARPHAVA